MPNTKPEAQKSLLDGLDISRSPREQLSHLKKTKNKTKQARITIYFYGSQIDDLETVQKFVENLDLGASTPDLGMSRTVRYAMAFTAKHIREHGGITTTGEPT